MTLKHVIRHTSAILHVLRSCLGCYRPIQCHVQGCAACGQAHSWTDDPQQFKQLRIHHMVSYVNSVSRFMWCCYPPVQGRF